MGEQLAFARVAIHLSPAAPCSGTCPCRMLSATLCHAASQCATGSSASVTGQPERTANCQSSPACCLSSIGQMRPCHALSAIYIMRPGCTQKHEQIPRQAIENHGVHAHHVRHCRRPSSDPSACFQPCLQGDKCAKIPVCRTKSGIVLGCWRRAPGCCSSWSALMRPSSNTGEAKKNVGALPLTAASQLSRQHDKRDTPQLPMDADTCGCTQTGAPCHHVLWRESWCQGFLLPMLLFLLSLKPWPADQTLHVRANCGVPKTTITLELSKSNQSMHHGIAVA